MLGILLMALADGAATTAPLPATPVIADLRLSSTMGSCSGGYASSSATVLIQWSLMATGGGAGYEVRVFKNGVLATTVDANTLSAVDTLEGLVETRSVDDSPTPDSVWVGNNNTFTTDWVYEVQMFETATGLASGERLRAEWRKQYGTCSGTEGPSGGAGGPYEGPGGVGPVE